MPELTRERSSKLIAFISSIAVAIYFSGGAAAILAGYGGVGVPQERLIPWLPPRPEGAVVVLYGLAMAALVPFLVAARRAAAALSSLLVALITVHWFAIDPFHNVVNHLVPFFFASSAVVLLRRRDAEDDDRLGDLVQTAARWMLGAIFTAQAWQSLSAGLLYFARRLYVQPFAESFLPEPLLYLAGLSNPLIQLIAGVMLLLSFRAG